MSALELKIPPPAVALLTGILMWLASHAAPSLAFEFTAHNIIAICVAAIGIIIAVGGVATFARAHTTINPTKPEKSTSLVTCGVYTITRNPMYLGLFLELTGWAFYLSNGVDFLFLPAFIIYMNRFQIVPEEKTLASLFGREFLNYQTRVRRWI